MTGIPTRGIGCTFEMNFHLLELPWKYSVQQRQWVSDCERLKKNYLNELLSHHKFSICELSQFRKFCTHHLNMTSVLPILQFILMHIYDNISC